jgi:hypothetical protein
MVPKASNPKSGQILFAVQRSLRLARLKSRSEGEMRGDRLLPVRPFAACATVCAACAVFIFPAYKVVGHNFETLRTWKLVVAWKSCNTSLVIGLQPRDRGSKFTDNKSVCSHDG